MCITSAYVYDNMKITDMILKHILFICIEFFPLMDDSFTHIITISCFPLFSR